MSVKVANTRFIFPSLKRWAALYQQLAGNLFDFQKLGARLVREAEAAQILRETWWLEEISISLSRFPIEEYRIIGQYYQAWCAYRKGQPSRDIFETVVETSETYRAKALLSCAAIEAGNEDYRMAVKLYQEAIRRSKNISTTIQAIRSIVAIKAMEGSHDIALKNLESIGSLLRYTNPIAKYQYLNSIAVELGEAGRVEEATNICRVVLASPYINAYPEWRETSNEIALKAYKSRSVVSAIKPVLENVIPLPVIERSFSTTQEKPARIISYERFKKNMVKEPNGDHSEPSEDVTKMSDKDLLIEIIQLASDKDVSGDDLRKILAYARKVVYGPKKN